MVLSWHAPQHASDKIVAPLLLRRKDHAYPTGDTTPHLQRQIHD
jgi:hypothetical protein